MKVVVQTPDSNEGFPLDVETSMRIDDFRSQVSGFLSSLSSTSLRKDYRLIFNGSPLFHGTLEENGVSEGAALVALPVRKPRPTSPSAEEPAPNKKEIMHATSNSPSKNARPSLSSLMTSLWSEIGSSNPSGAFPFPFSSLASTPANDNQPITVNVDPNRLQQLTEMGFPEERAKKALIICRMNPHLAMEWLLEHSEDPEADQPLTQEQLRRLVPISLTIPPHIASASKAPSSPSSTPANISTPSAPSSGTSSAPSSASSTAPSSASSTAPSSAPSSASFAPDPTALQQLMEMGFTQESVVDALRLTNNNQEAACSYLLGDREEESEESSSPFVRDILTHPVIQAGLTNPRVLRAFQMMIENPATMAQFIADPEVGPVLIHVHAILNNNSSNSNSNNNNNNNNSHC